MVISWNSPEGPEENRKKSNQDRCPDRESNRAPTEYNAESLPPELTCLVLTV